MLSLLRVVCVVALFSLCFHLNQAWAPSSVVSNNNRWTTTTTTRLSMARVPVLEDWKVLRNGQVKGVVTGHPDPELEDGDTITTSQLADPTSASAQAVVTTLTGSKYKLGDPKGFKKKNGKAAPTAKKAPFLKMAPSKPVPAKVASKKAAGKKPDAKSKQQFDAERAAQKKYNLNGKNIGPYLLSGQAERSTSGKSQIWTAYSVDRDGLPTGEPLAIKTSTNKPKLKKEYQNYKKVASGAFRGRFVKLIDFLPTAGDTSQFSSQSALVVERGSKNLKDYFKGRQGGLKGKALRDAAAAGAQCVQAVHSSRLVWTDLKPENFVLINDNSDNGGGIEIKGIDLESVCAVKDNPVDYSPESCPPEFTQALMDGEGPYFVLDYSYDIWSYGIMLYELATGLSPFRGKSASQIMRALEGGAAIDLSKVEDKNLQNLIEDCLEIDPKRRPSISKILLHPYFLTTGIGPFSF